MTTFIRNQWYVAAYAGEVGREPLARTILGEPIVLYRTESGGVAALATGACTGASRCRPGPASWSATPWSAGTTASPTTRPAPAWPCRARPAIPRTARVAAYPVVEQDSFVWVWIGDRELADPGTIPRAPWLADPAWTTVCGMEPLAARWTLLVDNLLDLSHETYLHGGYIGTPEVAETPITTEVDERRGHRPGQPAHGRRRLPAVLRRVHRHRGPDHALAGHRVPRALPVLCCTAGSPRRACCRPRTAPTGQAFHVEVVYAITPSTAEHSTYDFWAVARDFALDDEEVSDFLRDNNRTVVLQDVTALNLLETVIAAEPTGTRS